PSPGRRPAERHGLCPTTTSATTARRTRSDPRGQSHTDPCERPRRRKEPPEMKDRRNTLLWMKDLIEHMTQCHDQLQWAADNPTASFLTETMLVDLVECQ